MVLNGTRLILVQKTGNRTDHCTGDIVLLHDENGYDVRAWFEPKEQHNMLHQDECKCNTQKKTLRNIVPVWLCLWISPPSAPVTLCLSMVPLSLSNNMPGLSNRWMGLHGCMEPVWWCLWWWWISCGLLSVRRLNIGLTITCRIVSIGQTGAIAVQTDASDQSANGTGHVVLVKCVLGLICVFVVRIARL